MQGRSSEEAPGQSSARLSREVTLYAQDSLTITATLRPEGELQIHGHDLDAGRFYGQAGEEYEYVLTVTAEDVPLVVAGLGGRPEQDDVLEVLVAHQEEFVRRGENRWLEEHGIEPGFWGRRG